MQAGLFLTKTNNQSQSYLTNFNYLTNQNKFQLITRDQFHTNKMHADREHFFL